MNASIVLSKREKCLVNFITIHSFYKLLMSFLPSVPSIIFFSKLKIHFTHRENAPTPRWLNCIFLHRFQFCPMLCNNGWIEFGLEHYKREHTTEIYKSVTILEILFLYPFTQLPFPKLIFLLSYPPWHQDFFLVSHSLPVQIPSVSLQCEFS